MVGGGGGGVGGMFSNQPNLRKAKRDLQFTILKDAYGYKCMLLLNNM